MLWMGVVDLQEVRQPLWGHINTWMCVSVHAARTGFTQQGLSVSIVTAHLIQSGIYTA